MTLGVVICTRNRPAVLGSALSAISEQKECSPVVAVVDGSDAGVALEVRDICVAHGANYISGPSSLTLQRNIGVRNVTTDLVLFIDDDVVLSPTYCAAMVNAFLWDESLVGASGCTIDRGFAGVGGLLKKVWWRMFYWNTTTSVLPSVGPTIPYMGRRIVQTERLTGCNMVFRRSALVEHVEFDEDMRGYGLGEDVAAGLLMSRHGRLVWCGTALAYHRRSSANRDPWGTFRERPRVWRYIRSRYMGPVNVFGRMSVAWGSVGYGIEWVARLCVGTWRSTHKGDDSKWRS